MRKFRTPVAVRLEVLGNDRATLSDSDTPSVRGSLSTMILSGDMGDRPGISVKCFAATSVTSNRVRSITSKEGSTLAIQDRMSGASPSLAVSRYRERSDNHLNLVIFNHNLYWKISPFAGDDQEW